MTRVLFTFGCCLWVGLLGLACTEADEPPSALARTLGGVKEGAPLGMLATDPGILQDPKSYQPARGFESDRTMARGSGGSGAAKDELADTVQSLRDAIQGVQGRTARDALRLFSTEDVEALLSNRGAVDTLMSTSAAIDELQRYIDSSLSAFEVESVVGYLRGTGSDEVESVIGPDGTTATITPNIALSLFRPARESSELQAELRDGEWKFRLAEPLSDADVEQITSYNRRLQDELNVVIEGVAAAPVSSVAELRVQLGEALAAARGESGAEPGSEVEGTGEQPNAEGESGAEGEQPEGTPPEEQPRSNRRGLFRPGG